MSSAGSKKRYWQSRELITIGTFAALIEISTLLIAIAGGGMNPVTMVIKNIVATSLLIVLLYKVRKFGALTLFDHISLKLPLGEITAIVGNNGAEKLHLPNF